MQQHGVNVQRFRVAETKEDAAKIATDPTFKVREYVIKAQVLAGGRGKGTFDHGFKSGVHLTKDPKKVSGIVGEMLQHRLITKQTTRDGVLVKRVMVAEALDIEKETYLAFLMDRSTGGPVCVASGQGGMDIEEVAEKHPSSILKEPISLVTGITKQQALKIADKLGFNESKQLLEQTATQIMNIYKLFLSIDALQVEINPFGLTPQKQVVSFDAKIQFDDNAEFRQKKLFEMDDKAEKDPREVEAGKYQLNYIGMDGNIGCLVNGAGLAMATMDIVQLHGGKPANFLDVGGGATEEQVAQAFRILTSDSQVKCILVNIFGGIMNCVTIAKGVIGATRTLGAQMKVPVVVRLEGTNVREGRRLLNESGLRITTAIDFEDAAKKAVAALH